MLVNHKNVSEVAMKKFNHNAKSIHESCCITNEDITHVELTTLVAIGESQNMSEVVEKIETMINNGDDTIMRVLVAEHVTRVIQFIHEKAKKEAIRKYSIQSIDESEGQH